MTFKAQDSDNSLPTEEDVNRTKPKDIVDNRVDNEEDGDNYASEALSPNDVDRQLINVCF